MAMALERTLLSAKTHIFRKQYTSLPSSYISLKSHNKLNFRPRIIKCSYENSTSRISHNIGGGGGGVQYPRPTEVEWKKELCNLVHFTGIIGTPVQLKHLPSGKVLASSRLAVKASQNQTLWINLTFWDELAHIASQHVEKGQKIYVTGRLASDTTENGEGKQQTYYKVVVQQLNFIEKSLPSGGMHNGDSNSMSPGRFPSGGMYNGDSNSMSPQAGMFPSGGMYNGDSNSMSPGKRKSINHTGSIEGLWQAFFANPLEWWDNRKNKRSPKYPDFKHKDTGEALWVEGRTNPTWVKSQLAALDSRMGSMPDQNASSPVNFMSTDNFPFF